MVDIDRPDACKIKPFLYLQFSNTVNVHGELKETHNCRDLDYRTAYQYALHLLLLLNKTGEKEEVWYFKLSIGVDEQAPCPTSGYLSLENNSAHVKLENNR